ncbi:MAG: transposase [Bacteroidales bacterium]|nr:transposase [Bacteroidales bacterium]
MTREQKKDFARNLYINNPGITQKEVAKRVGVSAQTICKWVEAEKWEKLNKSLLLSKSETLADLYDQLLEAKNAVKNREEGKRFMSSKEADAVLKITAAIKNLETETNVAEKTEVGKQFLAFVRKITDFEQSKQIASYFDMYIKSCM